MNGVIGKKALFAALVAIIAALFVPPLRAQVADFNATSNVLSLPLVKLNGTAYSNVKVSFPPGQPMTVISVGAPSVVSPSMGVPTYNMTSAVLNIPYLQIGGALYYDVNLSASATQNWSLLGYSVSDPSIAAARGLARAGTGTPNAPSWAAVYGMTFPYNATISNRYATDTGGLLTYVMTPVPANSTGSNDIWRITSDDPCFPANAASTDAATRLTSNVMIVPNATTSSGNAAGVGDLIMVTTFDDGARIGVESCLVTPVQVNGVFVPPYQDMTTSVGTISGVQDQSYTVTVKGGTQPYTPVISRADVVSVTEDTSATSDATGVLGKTYVVKLLKAGSADVVFYDYYQRSKTVSVTATSSLIAFPSTITGNIGDVVTIFVQGGTPPYSVYIPMPEMISLPIAPGVASPTSMSIKLLAKTGGENGITLGDSAGAFLGIKVTINESATTTGSGSGTTGSTTTGTSGSSSGSGSTTVIFH